MNSSYETLNIPFADGTVLRNVSDDAERLPGDCSTCDFGAEYINDVQVNTTNFRIDANFNAQYEFAFSTAMAILIFCGIEIRKTTEREFVEYLTEQFRKISSLTKLTVTGPDGTVAGK